MNLDKNKTKSDGQQQKVELINQPVEIRLLKTLRIEKERLRTRTNLEVVRNNNISNSIKVQEEDDQMNFVIDIIHLKHN